MIVLSDFVVHVENFDLEIIEDPRVWLVYFYSPSDVKCVNFLPEWSNFSGNASQVVMATKIPCDPHMEFGLNVAKQIGVLDEGIPNIRLFTGRIPHGFSILKGNDVYETGIDTPPATKHELLLSLLKKELEGKLNF